jgi:nucleoid DNA-binding protein
MAVKKGTAKKKLPAKKKATAKKAVAKKSSVEKKKTATKKQAATPARKLTAIRERYSKTDIINELAINSGLNRKQSGIVLDDLAVLVERHVKKRSVGKFVLAGLIKVTTVKRPAKKARKGINPFTGKMTSFKAKLATTAVKVHALKGLKDMAQ